MGQKDSVMDEYEYQETQGRQGDYMPPPEGHGWELYDQEKQPKRDSEQPAMIVFRWRRKAS